MEGKANPPFSFTFPIANFRITLFDLWKEEGCKGSTNADDNRGRNGSRLEKGRSFPGVLNAGGGGGILARKKARMPNASKFLLLPYMAIDLWVHFIF